MKARALALATAVPALGLMLVAWAEKPPQQGVEDPPPVEAPGGRMLVYGAGGDYDSLAPDGSSKTVEFSLADTQAAGFLDGFSHLLHDGAIWQLAAVCAVDGDPAYPDGGGRRFLYAENSEDHTLVQLTDDPDFEIEWWSTNARPKWAYGDSRIYLVGFRWALDETTGEHVRVDSGLYHIDLPDDVSRLTAAPALHYAVPIPIHAVDAFAIALDGDHVAFTLVPGTRKFPTKLPAGIYVCRASAGTAQLVHQGAASSCLAWSKAGDRIAFVGEAGRALLTMNADGGEVRAASSVSHPDRSSITSMCWSPGDTHIGYSQLTTTNGHEEVRHMMDVYCVPAGGGTPVNVTENDDSQLNIRAWY